EDSIYNQIASGNVPDFQRNLVPVTILETIGSDTFNIMYFVLPDYLALGCDTDYFLCPMTPVLAQRIAYLTDCSLPTRKMVNEIYSAATVKLAPSTIAPGPEMTTVPVFAQHNTTVWGQRSAVLEDHPLGEPVGGDKKDVILSNGIYSASTDRVVIYGWHQLNGTPIQPLYNGHDLYYADYSHGIRFVQMNILVNVDTLRIDDILQSGELSPLLSDEGVIAIPFYPVPVETPEKPYIFAVVREDESSIRIFFQEDPAATWYKAELSQDGLVFDTEITLNPSDPVISGLNTGEIYFVRLTAGNATVESGPSEVLGAIPSWYSSDILVINGFDRNSTGNTYNFIRQHGSAIHSCGYTFSSATNEAMESGMVLPGDYPAVDYILGEESSVNETFNTAEQTIISAYLDSGGKLFVSGAETGWDLDHLGSTSDKDFYRDYLKASYVYDAPNNQSSTWYGISAEASQIFDGTSSYSFDNGTHGTYNVVYPDVISGYSGGESCLYYTGLTGQSAGICFAGIFPAGTTPGKIVNMGVPFETVYPETSRNGLMDSILTFFFDSTAVQISVLLKKQIEVYPNPCTDMLSVRLLSHSVSDVVVRMMSPDGREVLRSGAYTEKGSVISINTEGLPAGVYALEIRAQGRIFRERVIVVRR
ncbi:MAG: T9SS type A sorting domain-containing protein, partial [Bacteroidetes bacterium]|nr:T9SS type A sorting domain-containing protein [Bacteroidota bacterium]